MEDKWETKTETETWAMGSPYWHSVKPLRPAVCTREVLSLPGSQEGLMHTGRHVCVRKNSPGFILVKAFLTEYGSQDTDFTIPNLKNVSIICKLNVQLSCLKRLDKKHEAMKCLANVLPVTKLRILYFISMELFSCSISAADSRIGLGAWCETTFMVSPQSAVVLSCEVTTTVHHQPSVPGTANQQQQRNLIQYKGRLCSWKPWKHQYFCLILSNTQHCKMKGNFYKLVEQMPNPRT